MFNFLFPYGNCALPRLFLICLHGAEPEQTQRHAAENEEGQNVRKGRDKGICEYRGVDLQSFCQDGNAASHDLRHDDGEHDRHAHGGGVEQGIGIAEDETVDELQFCKAHKAYGNGNEERYAYLFPDDAQDIARPYFVERHAADDRDGRLAARVAARTHDHGHARHQQGGKHGFVGIQDKPRERGADH